MTRGMVSGIRMVERTRMSKGGGAAVQRVKGRRSKVGQGYFLHLPSYFFHLTSSFEHPPSPSTLKGLHLSLVFSPLRGKKTAPPVALAPYGKVKGRRSKAEG